MFSKKIVVLIVSLLIIILVGILSFSNFFTKDKIVEEKHEVVKQEEQKKVEVPDKQVITQTNEEKLAEEEMCSSSKKYYYKVFNDCGGDGSDIVNELFKTDIKDFNKWDGVYLQQGYFDQADHIRCAKYFNVLVINPMVSNSWYFSVNEKLKETLNLKDEETKYLDGCFTILPADKNEISYVKESPYDFNTYCTVNSDCEAIIGNDTNGLFYFVGEVVTNKYNGYLNWAQRGGHGAGEGVWPEKDTYDLKCKTSLADSICYAQTKYVNLRCVKNACAGDKVIDFCECYDKEAGNTICTTTPDKVCNKKLRNNSL